MTDEIENTEENISIRAECLDQKIVEIPIKIAEGIQTIKDMLDSFQEGLEVSNEAFPLQVNSDILESILKYVDYHQRNPKVYEEEQNNNKDPIYIVEWDKTFLQDFLDKSTQHQNLLKLYEASHFLQILTLRKLIAKQMAKMIHEAADPNAVREEFGIENT